MGGFGAVYLGVDTKHGDRPVAIKDMIGNDPQEFAIRLNFFRREAEILRSLEPVPIVPRMYDLIQQGQTAHLVMEFIRGKDLLDIMEGPTNKPFPLTQVIEWGKSHLRRAAAHAHADAAADPPRSEAGQHHAAGGPTKSIKMIDFGTARDLGRTVKERRRPARRASTPRATPRRSRSSASPSRAATCSPWPRPCITWPPARPPRAFTPPRKSRPSSRPNGPAIPKEQRWFLRADQASTWPRTSTNATSPPGRSRADLEKQQVTRELACPKCGQVNKVRDPSTACKCAEPLTDATPPCYHCGKMNRMGSRFCIHCGNRLR